jgi:hypothetical protein
MFASRTRSYKLDASPETLMRFPVKAPLSLRQIKGDFILHDPASNSVHRLNSVAALVWQLCDGKRDRLSIVTEVATLYGKPVSEVAGDVDDILARFIEGGLVYSSPGRREADVLLQCVQAAVGSGCGDNNTPQQAWSDLEWPYIEQTALQHGVLPLLYRGLGELGTEAVPMDVMQRLARHFRSNAERNQFLFEELLELVGLFDAHDIPAVPFKGPVLATLLYGDVALRQFGDLDIFIPAQHADRAKDLLRTRGCQFHSQTTLNVEAEYRVSHGGQVNIDLQWAFAPKLRFPVDFEKFWASVVRVDVGPATVRQPSPADQARMLAAHAAKHCWSRLVWLSDVAAFIDRHQHSLDWHQTMEGARRSGAARIVCVGARLACDLFGTVIPGPVSVAIDADPKVDTIATEVRLRVFAPVKDPPNVRGSYGVWEGGLLYIRARERLRDKLPFIWHLLGMPFKRAKAVITPNRHDRSVIALPRWVGFLYYLVRPVRLSVQYCVDLRNRLRIRS